MTNQFDVDKINKFISNILSTYGTEPTYGQVAEWQFNQCQEEISRLEKDVSEWKVMCKEAEIQAEKNNNRRYKEIGLMEYKGNSVGFIYDKMLARGLGIDKLLVKEAALLAVIEGMQKELEFTCGNRCAIGINPCSARECLESVSSQLEKMGVKNE